MTSVPGVAGDARTVVLARPTRTASQLVRPEALRQAFRRHAAGVTVVTLAGPAGPVGFTATSVASLSAQPPLLSFSLATTSSSAPAMLEAETLVVHLLSSGQEELARRFSTRGVDRFAPPVRWKTLATGEPLLSDVPVWLRARIQHRIATGESYLVIAEVLESRVDRADEPLVYHDGHYGTVTDAPAPEGPAQDPEA